VTDKQCPSCGGNCGRTVKSGCLYNSPVERKALRVTANAQQAEIESLRQRVAELESLGRISEKQIIIGLEARLAACEKERDELFEAMQHPSYEVENDLRAKNQNLFNALMKSTAYSDKLNQRITELEQICRDAYEIYAGSEGVPEPETAAEAYVYQLLMQMKDEIARGLK